MAEAKQIDVDTYVDSQKVSSFNWSLVFWSFIITLIDGYDIVAAPAAGPFFVKEWGLQSPAALTAAFSAANFGVLFGAPLFGWIGDRYGRKIAIILSLLVFGLLTMVVTQANSVEHLMWARFVTGFGIGGVMANTIALNAEMAPRHMRATFIILMFIGNTLGGFFPPMVANFFVATHGWQLIFWIGGIAPIIIAAICWFTIPESLKFLSQDAARQDETRRLAQRMRSDIEVGPQDRIVTLHHSGVQARFSDLFAGKFAVLTPLLWLLFAINLMVFYFIGSWMQTIIGPAIAKAGGNPATAQTANAMFQLGGSVCGLVMARFIDRMGLRPVVLLIVLAIPATAAIGYFATTPWLIWVASAAGFCLLGIQFGLNATAGMIYPTYVRSYGVGWAFGIGRFGAFGGPALGGMLIAMQVPLGQLYLYAATPLIISLLACLWMIRLHDTSRDKAPAGAAELSH